MGEHPGHTVVAKKYGLDLNLYCVHDVLVDAYYYPVITPTAVTQHTTACCSAQVIDIILTEGLIRKYHIP